MIAQIAAAAYFGYKQCKLSGRRHWSPFDLFFDFRSSVSTEASAKEQEAPSSTAEQLEEPQANPSDAVLEDRIAQAVIDKLMQHMEPQIIINIFGGNHIVAPNAQEAYQQFNSSTHSKKKWHQSDDKEKSFNGD